MALVQVGKPMLDAISSNRIYLHQISANIFAVLSAWLDVEFSPKQKCSPKLKRLWELFYNYVIRNLKENRDAHLLTWYVNNDMLNYPLKIHHRERSSEKSWTMMSHFGPRNKTAQSAHSHTWSETEVIESQHWNMLSEMLP